MLFSTKFFTITQNEKTTKILSQEKPQNSKIEQPLWQSLFIFANYFFIYRNFHYSDPAR
jgi:hypothetical protein